MTYLRAVKDLTSTFAARPVFYLLLVVTLLVMTMHFKNLELALNVDLTAPMAKSSAIDISKRKLAISNHLAKKYRQPLENIKRYVDYAWAEASRHRDISPELLLAVMQKESSMNSKAKSSYGAEGLMQVVRRFHPEKIAHDESLLTPHVNIRVGAQILQEYFGKTQVWTIALKKYSGNARGYADFVIDEMAQLEQI